MSRLRAMSFGRKLAITWLLGFIVFIAIYGFKGHRNEAFNVVGSFHIVTWFHIVGPLNFNKGVLYLLIAAGLTVGILLYVAKRMEAKPGRLQVAIEWMYDLMLRTTKDQMPEQMASKWFPVIFTLFVFILTTNLIGYIPLPVNSGQTFKIFGAHIPSLQIYSADTNVAFPLILALSVFLLFTYEGVKHHGPIGYVKSLMPGGVKGPIVGLIFPIEVMSNFLRLISLTVRLWANLLAGHLLIAFMGGELGVLVGDPWVSWLLLPFGVAIFMFEAVLIAGLQAFIFAILTAIYLGSAVESH
jgi:F-type H+-transporting ATPase subunit a